jgi:hypothetical protein
MVGSRVGFVSGSWVVRSGFVCGSRLVVDGSGVGLVDGSDGFGSGLVDGSRVGFVGRSRVGSGFVFRVDGGSFI